MTSKNYEHQGQKRSNIPTQEGEKYMNDKDREAIPYEPDVRNAEAPRLAWNREKPDQVHREAGPLYIHEKVEPSAFLNQLKDEERSLKNYSLFDDLPEHAKYEWYQHKGNWSNRIIHGDSAQIMTSLATREQMEGQVQMVYFDPPYGISFKSTMQVDTRKNENSDNVEGISPEPEMCAMFRDTYKRGIHDYLDAIRENAILARSLLSESGSFFLQIGNANMPIISVLLDEVFGSENRIAFIPFKKSGSKSAKFLPQVCDFLLWYAKDSKLAKFHQLYEGMSQKEKLSLVSMVELADGTQRNLTPAEKENLDTLPTGARLFGRSRLHSQSTSLSGRSEPFFWNGVLWPCPTNEHWRVSMEGLQKLAELGRLYPGKASLSWKIYEDEIPGRKINNMWNQQMQPSDKHYVVETSERVINRAVLMTTDPGDLVLDITCGSGTTAFVAESWGRRWITTDASRVPIALTRQRILSGVHKWFVLANSYEGRILEADYTKSRPKAGSSCAVDPGAGFVYKRTCYVSAATLAYDQPQTNIFLVDQPHISEKVKRLSSSFTVESLSPFRTITPEEYLQKNHQIESQTNVIDALETSGINTTDAGRLHLHNIELFDSEGGIITYQAEIDFRVQGELAGTKPCAVTLLPDDATASQSWIVEAANIAAALRKFDELLVIAFNFESDALVNTPQNLGRLKIRCCRANRDLMIGSLDNKRTDEAFIQIGEPDVRIKEVNNSQINVEILGYDTFDPITGNLKKGDSTGIDCWMIDTNYDQTGFYAHRIHFPGKSNDKQLLQYRKKLGKEIYEEKWNAMLSTKSTPFPKPLTGYIAVRIITNTSVEMTTVKNVLRSLEDYAVHPPHRNTII